MNNEKNEVSNENALVASVERYMEAERDIDDILATLISMKQGTNRSVLKPKNEKTEFILRMLRDNFETISNKELWK